MPVAINSMIRTVEVGVVPKRRTSEACSAAYGTYEMLSGDLAMSALRRKAVINGRGLVCAPCRLSSCFRDQPLLLRRVPSVRLQPAVNALVSKAEAEIDAIVRVIAAYLAPEAPM